MSPPSVSVGPEPFDVATQSYLRQFSDRWSAEDLLELLDGIRPLRVLAIGEAIVDAYQYCVSIGRSAKDPTLVVRHLSDETFAGGIIAVANHLCAFADRVGVVTALASDSPHAGFIEGKLHRGIAQHLVGLPGLPTIVKKRIVERYHFAKLLEVYEMDETAFRSEEYNARLCEVLESVVHDYDLVVAVDFGHGVITDDAVQILSKKAKFLAVNAQANAGNFGYHTISRYRRADYVSMTDRELRLDARQRGAPPEQLIASVAERTGSSKVAVTLGSSGCLCHAHGGDTVKVPAVASRVVDRIGSGDAFLALSALCAAKQLPLEVCGFLGNVAGAQAVGIVGHRTFLDRDELVDQIRRLLGTVS